MMSASNCQVVPPAQVWSAAPTLSPRVKRLRDQYWSFYERDYTNEARSYTTGTPWDIVYSIWSWTNVPEVAMFQPDARAGIPVIAPELRGWILKGDFVEFQRTDPYVERQMGSSLLRYNAYTGVRNAGVIRVRSVAGAFSISRLQVAKDFALARLAALVPYQRGGITLPLAVRRTGTGRGSLPV